VDFAVTGARSEFDNLAVLALFMIACVLGAIILTFALVRNRVDRGIALVLVVAPPLFFGAQFGGLYVTAPSNEALEAGHGYFARPADRALADGVVAGDGRNVAELAPAANLSVIGFDGMTSMGLAPQEGHADPAVVAALLRAGTDPDRDNQMLFGFMTEDNGDNGLMIKQQDGRLLRAVIDAGVDLNHENQEKLPRFFSALKWPEGFALMLEHGASAEAEDKDGNTAIVWAVRLWYWPAIDVLLAHGARIDHVAPDGQGLRGAVQEKLERYQSDRRDAPGLAQRACPATLDRSSIDYRTFGPSRLVAPASGKIFPLSGPAGEPLS
jgi:hypothetical protein